MGTYKLSDIQDSIKAVCDACKVEQEKLDEQNAEQAKPHPCIESDQYKSLTDIQKAYYDGYDDGYSEGLKIKGVSDE